jgi:hypothetical protein
MSNEIVKAQANIITTLDDAERAARAMAQSGYFADAKQAAQAIVKVLAGHEMGFGPFASMTGIHIIQGRPAIGANLMAAAVKANPRYDYRVKEMSNERCLIAFFEGGQPIGESEFTLADAKAAGTKNLDRFPRNMLFARAMSNGVRWYCPDVFSGSTVYTPEELGAVVDGEGNVVSMPVVEVVEEPQPVEEVKPEQTPVIIVGGKSQPVSEMSDKRLEWFAENGKGADKAIAQAELERRAANEAVEEFHAENDAQDADAEPQL